MQEHTEQHLDKLSKKIFKTSQLDTPSVDFTATIISKIDTLSIKTAIVHKPLISKLGWFLVTLIVLAIVGYTTYGNVESSSWLEGIDYSVITNNKVTHALSGITISKIVAYAIVFFGVAWFIQIPMMTHYFNKRLDF